MDLQTLLRRAVSAEDCWQSWQESLQTLAGASTIAEIKTSKQRVGAMWEEFCAAYLRLQGYTVTNWRDTTLESRTVWGMPRKTDLGIDLVAEKQGTLTAVQCKWRTKPSALALSHLKIFLPASEKRHIWKYRLVMTTTTGVSWKGLKPSNVRVLGLKTWQNLPRAVWAELAGDTGHRLADTAAPISTAPEPTVAIDADTVRKARLARFA